MREAELQKYLDRANADLFNQKILIERLRFLKDRAEEKLDGLQKIEDFKK